MKKRFDERDTLFARLRMKPGSDLYKDYYLANPEKELTDNNLRDQKSNSGLFEISSNETSSEKLVAHSINQGMAVIKKFIDADNQCSTAPKRTNFSPDSLTEHIQSFLAFLGAADCGFTATTEESFYQFSGKGHPRNEFLPHAIVFAVEMKQDFINRAPNAEAMLATVEAYIQAAYIGCRLSMHLKNLGFKTDLNTVFGYSAPLVPLAIIAGLGKIGRNNLLINPRFGARIRLGAVFTDAEVHRTSKPDFELESFCKDCGLCLENCPGKSFSNGFNAEKCYQIWLNVRTDCGICISSCPFSQTQETTALLEVLAKKEPVAEYLRNYRQKYGKRNYLKNKLPVICFK